MYLSVKPVPANTQISNTNYWTEIADMGFDPSRTIAFGDGGNDLSMILQAGIGVAMGNATPELKQHADYITTSVDDDGILNALKHFNLTQRGRLTMRHLLKNDAK